MSDSQAHPHGHLDLPPPYTNFQYYNNLCNAADFLRKRLGDAEVAIVLGSGLNNFAERLSDVKAIPYNEIPFMPLTTVAGHHGKIVYGHVSGKAVYCFAGRVHGYEGYPSYQLSFIARLSVMLGVKTLILTNAAGGCVKGMKPGAIMIIKDHLNLNNRNPLEDCFEDPRFGPRHPNATALYSTRIADFAKEVAAEENIPGVYEGVYCWTSGPTYETPSEIRAFMKAGGGAVGMSTVPEVVAAVAMDVEVFGVSLVTNAAAGLADEVLTHEAVTVEANLAGPRMEALIIGILRKLTPLPVKPMQKLAEGSFCVPLVKEHALNVPAPTFERVAEAAHLITVANAFQKPLTLSYSIGHGQEAVLNGLVDVRELAFSEVPHMPRLTASGRDARFVLGTTADGIRVIAIAGTHLEGFDPLESRFIVSLLLILGIRELVVTLPAVSTAKTSFEDGQLVLIRDYHNHVRQGPAYLSDEDSIQNQVQDAKSQPKSLSNRLASVFSVSADVLIGYPGPSMATKSEMNLAQLFGADLVSYTNLSPLDSSSLAGLDVAVVAVVANQNTYTHIRNVLNACGESLQKIFSASIVNGARCTVAQPLRPQPEPHVGHAVSIKRHKLELPAQGNFDEAESCANRLKEAFGSTGSSVGFLVHQRFASLLPKILNISHQISFHDVDSSFTWADKTTTPKFVYGSLVSDPSVYAVGLIGMRPYVEGEPSAVVTKGSRIMHSFGVTSYFLVSPMDSCVPAVAVGTVSVPVDCINFTGQSPLTGRNDSRWGVRFPDMGAVQNTTFSNGLLTAGKSANGSLSTGIVGWMNNAKLYHSMADATVATSFGCETLTATGIAELIAIRHANHQALFSGVVVKNVASTVATEISEDVLCQSVDSLAAMFNSSLSQLVKA
eukprot:GILJ01003499.1.p1 GENE.GILJ01003499.1~~GILJ01003499.1.p1  ORF type:complete len:892 (-),score=162.25 GILJ01003499.1:151-2826(-)